jgi:hypothetical protein
VTENGLGFKLGLQKLHIFVLHKHAGVFFLQPDGEVGDDEDEEVLHALKTFNAIGDFPASHPSSMGRTEYGIELHTVGVLPEDELRMMN